MGLVCMGLDVHKDSISVGMLEPGSDSPVHDKIFHGEASIRRLMGRFEPGRLPVCYEAGRMARLLPRDRFAEWFDDFLADLSPLTAAVTVTGRSAPQTVHLDGPNLSRAWCWLRARRPAWRTIHDGHTPRMPPG